MKTFARHDVAKGDLVVSDRAYGTRLGLRQVVDLGAGFLVRLTWRNLPLANHDGVPFDLIAALRTLPDAETLECAQETGSSEASKHDAEARPLAVASCGSNAR